MARLVHATAALSLALALGACSEAANTPDPDAAADTDSETTATSASEPTDLYVAHVVATANANSAGCLDAVRTDWAPEPKVNRQRVCGVQNDTETWFTIDPTTAFDAAVTKAEAKLPETATGGIWVVEITLDDKSAKRFGQMVSKLLTMPAPDPVALIVRGEVVSAPVPTPGLENLSTLQIAGGFSREEAEQIAAGLDAQ